MFVHVAPAGLKLSLGLLSEVSYVDSPRRFTCLNSAWLLGDVVAMGRVYIVQG
jgi:hypothetical protein